MTPDATSATAASTDTAASPAATGGRTVTIARRTRETDITLVLDLDGSGTAHVETGIGFLDHMLQLFAHHGRFDLDVRAAGDLDTGSHHTVEDIGICLGQAIDRAVGDKAGIARYGTFHLPMDEALALVSLDLSGRPFLAYDVPVAGGVVGGFETEMAGEFFQAVANNARMTLHVRLLAGSNPHHIIEAVFKGFARALAQAVGVDPQGVGVPSTKGVL